MEEEDEEKGGERRFSHNSRDGGGVDRRQWRNPVDWRRRGMRSVSLGRAVLFFWFKERFFCYNAANCVFFLLRVGGHDKY